MYVFISILILIASILLILIVLIQNSKGGGLASESVKDLDDEQSKSLEDSCLTETLARIYIKKKR